MSSAFIHSLHTTLLQFWSQHPCLLHGIMAVWGAAIAVQPTLWPYFVATFIVLALTTWNRNKVIAGIIVAISAYYLTDRQILLPQHLEIPIEGIATVNIDNIKTTTSPFGEMRVYRGTLATFNAKGSNNQIAKNIPITISETLSAPQKSIEYTYEIQGKIKRSPQGRFSLTTDKGKEWVPLKNRWTLAQWRYEEKKAFQNMIYQNISNPHTAAFLSGMAIGEFDDMQLSFELGRLGLQHLMAISGIHFSIIAGILAFFFGMIFGKRYASGAVIVLLTAYFVFLGHSPSVLRAWIAITIFLGTIFVQRRNRALNSLGLGMMAIAFADPLAITTIPFQFSFGITASILLWFGPCDELLQKVSQTRSLSKITHLHWLDQHAYCILFFLRQGLALALAVNLAALPITIFYFQKFPAMSLLYNLFFPFLVSGSMLLLVLALPFLLIAPPVAQFFLYINEKYTGFILDFVFNLPKHFDASWVVTTVNKVWILSLLILVFTLGIIAKGYTKEQESWV